MAKKHVKKVNKMIAQLEALQSEVEALQDELQEHYDNLSDYAQESEYGQDLEDIIDSLEAVNFDGISTAIDELKNAETSLETLPASAPKEEDAEVNIDIDIAMPLAAGITYWRRKRSEKKKQNQQKQEPPYNPYDNHWGHSFDWLDEDGDGYDDREDGFLE